MRHDDSVIGLNIGTCKKEFDSSMNLVCANVLCNKVFHEDCVGSSNDQMFGFDEWCCSEVCFDQLRIDNVE